MNTGRFNGLRRFSSVRPAGRATRNIAFNMGFRILAPGFLHTGRGGSKSPGSPGWRPLSSSKAFGLQQSTGYHLFTIHSYLLPSPTQVGDAGRVRELTYSYKLRSGIKKSLADWRDFSVCVGITYLPGKSPCKYCRRR